MQVIEFYAEFAKLTGSIPAAVFLTYALKCQKHYGGWFSKTFTEWEKATTLDRKQQISVREKLRALGVLREVRKGIGYKLWYWVDVERLNQMLNGTLKAENPTSRRRKSQHPDAQNRTSRCLKRDIQMSKTRHPDVQKCDVFTTTGVDTYVNNVSSTLYLIENDVVKGDCVDHVVESSSFLQDSLYKKEFCLLNTHAEQSSAVCLGQGQTTSCEDDGKERKQTDLVITAGNFEAHDKKDDASGTSTSTTHSLTVTPTIAENKGAARKLQRAELWENGNDAKTEGAGTLNSENAQKSLIGDFLARDIPEVVAEQENAPERLETALKRKSTVAGKAENGDAAKNVPESDDFTDAQDLFAMHVSAQDAPEVLDARDCVSLGLKTASKRGVRQNGKREDGKREDEKQEGGSQRAKSVKKKQKTETPEEREFREGFYDFAKKAVDWIVSKGGVREDPASFWSWAKRLKQRDNRITPDILKECFRHYAASTDGTWWRSNTKTLKQFVTAFEDIYQSYQQSYSHVQSNQSNQSNQPNQKGDNHAFYSANHEFHKRAKYWQQWFQTACQAGLPKTRET
jgi:hypothetical protein